MDSIYTLSHLRHCQAQRSAPAGEPLGLPSSPSGDSVMFPYQLNKRLQNESAAVEYGWMHPVRLEVEGGSVTGLSQLWCGLLWFRSALEKIT